MVVGRSTKFADTIKSPKQIPPFSRVSALNIPGAGHYLACLAFIEAHMYLLLPAHLAQSVLHEKSNHFHCINSRRSHRRRRRGHEVQLTCPVNTGGYVK
ncbi:hypothetical protein V6N11_002635 [Hibiscus sabdariffa]|uniref:Uncharacterized protein n=1 Tax=Hibiscus sabdariffa TaxID=183260 RepID=A0ABR2SAZ3_9ROSI